MYSNIMAFYPTLALLLFCACTCTSAFGLFGTTRRPFIPATSCAWLPWKMSACTKKGSVYQKVETRKKIQLRLGANCSPKEETRRTRKCTASQYITSTILEAVAYRSPQDSSSHDRVPNCPSAWRMCPHSFSRTNTTAKPKPITRKCGHGFTDPVTRVRMLGAICHQRTFPWQWRRVSQVPRIRQKRFFHENHASIEHRDILFLLDESGSINQRNFNTMLKFVEALSGKFSSPRHIARDATRVAVSTFASNPRHPIGFLDSSSYGGFRSLLRSEVTFGGGWTCMIKALESVRLNVFTRAGGSRVPDKTADGLLIIVTDGCFNCPRGGRVTKLKEEQVMFEDMGVSVVIFMIGVKSSCMEHYTALEDGSTCFRGFGYPSWSEFETEVQNILNAPQITAWTKKEDHCPT